MEEKENKISETKQEEIKDDPGIGEETKDEKEAEYVEMRGDGCILPNYWKMFLPIVILFLIIDIFFLLTEIW